MLKENKRGNVKCGRKGYDYHTYRYRVSLCTDPGGSRRRRHRRRCGSGFPLSAGICGDTPAQYLNYGRTHVWFVPVWFLILAAAAVIVTLLLKMGLADLGQRDSPGEGEIMGEIDECWWRVLTAKLAGGLIGLGCGLSLGREGPSIQLGAMAAKGFSRLTKRVKTEEKLLMTCGATAGLSAAFNAPIAEFYFLWRRFISTFLRRFCCPPWRLQLHRTLFPEMYLA